MPLSFQIARRGAIRRFTVTLLLVSVAVLTVGLIGSFIVLWRVERQLLAHQAQSAEREAAIIARFVDRDLSDGASANQTIGRVQSALKGTGTQADFLCLLDQDGRVLSHPDPGMIGVRWGDMDMTPLDARETLPISSVLRSRRPSAGTQHEADEPPQLVHYQPVEREPWTIAVHKNTAAIGREFAALRWKLFGTAIPTLLLISLIGVGLARSLGARFEAELTEKNAGLEIRVRERTAELRRALEELRTAHERLLQGEKMHLLGELMAGIAHEINNPLAAISLYSELLALGHANDAKKAGVIISQQARRVASIVHNLLDFARNRPAQRVPGSLSDVLRKAEELIAAELRQVGVAFEASISPELPNVMMDAQQMEQVFINLVRNATQALAAQPGAKRISVRAFTDGIWVAVSVQDNGPGVPAELRAKIFDSFVTTKSDGTGLGLSLCKRFVEAHGGALELLSTPTGEGACFQFRLPVLSPGDSTMPPATEPADADPHP